ncbi:MAG: hypothetical protein KKC01_12660 [Gammaproteobacteria bacterium]|nr:hypothetical protein [Gammaproteobacteria bacterium]
MSTLRVSHHLCFDQTTLWLPHWFSLCLLLSVAACSDPDDGGKLVQSSAGTAADGVIQVESTLRLALNQAIPGLDPLRAGSHESNQLIGAVYDRLYRYALLARPHQILPQAAADMPVISAEGRHYRIALRPDLRFHHSPDLTVTAQQGRSVQAGDVVYSLLRHFDPALQSPWRWLWAGRIQGLDAWGRNGADYAQAPEGLQVADDGTLHITLTTPQADFLHLLAHPSAAIVMREAVQQHGQAYALHAVGSGPYRLHELSLSRITLLAVDDFRSQPMRLSSEGFQDLHHADSGLAVLAGRSGPLLQRIEIEIERSAQQRLQWLRDGHIDALLLPPEQYPQVLARVAQHDSQNSDHNSDQKNDQNGDLNNSSSDSADSNVLLHPDRLAADWIGDWRMHRQPAAEWLRIDFNLHSTTLGNSAGADDELAETGLSQSPEKQTALRCALRDSIDWDSFNRRFHHGSGYVSNGVIAPVITAHAGAVPSSSIGRSDAFADFAVLPDLVFAHVDSRRNRAYFDWFQQQLLASGYAADKLRSLPHENLGALLQSYREQQWPLLFSAWSLDLPTATNTLQLYAGNNAHIRSGGPGLANYRNAEYDQLLRQLSSQTGDDPALEQRMLALLARDCVVSSGFSPARIHVWRKDLLAWPDADFAAGEWLRFAALAENQHNE